MLDDTIAAIATPLGEGGLAVIRISGPQALAVADRCFAPAGGTSMRPSAAATHTIHFGHVVRNGQSVDEVLLAVMRAPRTFTREDVVEITCHGGILAAKLVLDAVLASGARLAEPGEFTRRAFLNGRIDLAQAEAVADLIHSRTELALRAANEQLAGKLSQRINQLREGMVEALAHIEAHIDFPEEDIAPDTRAQLIARLERGVALHGRAAAHGQRGRRSSAAASGRRSLAGPTRASPACSTSSRATTAPSSRPFPARRATPSRRPPTSAACPWYSLTPPACARRATRLRSKACAAAGRRLQQAELILHVFDVSEPLTAADEAYLAEFAGKKRILVRNKMDLPARLQLPAVADGPVVEVCCLTGQGIETLKDAIKELVWSGEIKAEMLQVMINSRHQDALNRARAATLRTLDALRRSPAPGTRRGGPAHRRQCRRRNRRPDHHRRPARPDLQPVLHREIGCGVLLPASPARPTMLAMFENIKAELATAADKLAHLRRFL